VLKKSILVEVMLLKRKETSKTLQMENIIKRDTEDSLVLLHYSDQASHPSEASLYKGVVVEGS
jgi:hypothetical protein